MGARWPWGKVYNKQLMVNSEPSDDAAYFVSSLLTVQLAVRTNLLKDHYAVTIVTIERSQISTHIDAMKPRQLSGQYMVVEFPVKWFPVPQRKVRIEP